MTTCGDCKSLVGTLRAVCVEHIKPVLREQAKCVYFVPKKKAEKNA